MEARWCQPITPEEMTEGKPRVFSPQFAIPKPSGEPRLVHDAREPNMFFDVEVYHTDSALFPLTERWKFATKIDLRSSFMHWDLDE